MYSRYLYETGQFPEALELLNMAYAMCPNPDDSLAFAHLCNTAGVIYYDQNDLEHCQEILERSLKIRKKLLEPGDQELATTYGNLGTVLVTVGRYDDALEYLEMSDKARLGNDPAMHIADAVFQSTYGWALRRKREYTQAKEKYEKARIMYSNKPGLEMLVA